MLTDEVKQNITTGLTYWALGGFILGLVEILVNLPLYPWMLPNIITFLPGPVYYALAGIIAASIFSGLVLLCKKELNLPVYAAGNISFIIFVWTAKWASIYFEEALEQHNAVHLFHLFGLLLIAYGSEHLLYKFFVRQKDNLWSRFVAISIALYTFIAIILFLYPKLPYILSSNNLQYLLFTITGCILLFFTVYYLLEFSKKFSLPIKIVEGGLILTGIFFIILSITQNKATPSQKANVTVLNKQEVLSKEKPNILLITPDTLRADRLSCYGQNNFETKAIDSIAQKGVLFKNAQAPAPWTMSSFASMLTSQYPSVHGGVKDGFTGLTKVSKNVVWLAQILKEAGYTTQAYTINPYLNKMYGFNKGFDEYYHLGRNIVSDEEKETLGEQRIAFLWKSFFQEELGTRFSANRNIIINQKALNWLDKNTKSPFFLWVHYLDPHMPYEREKAYNLDKKYNGPLKDDRIVRSLVMLTIITGSYKLNQADKDYLKSIYDEEVLYIDENVGKILKKLEDLNIMDNTLVIFASDHGEELWDHGEFGHGHTLYKELLDVPLILKYPKMLPQGKILENTISLIDLMPTILEIAGIKHDADLAGKSLIPLIQEKEEENRTVFAEAVGRREKRKAIITDRYKFIYFPESQAAELYDLLNDPQEKINLVNDKPELAARLKTQLLNWIEECQKKADKLNKGEGPEQIKINNEIRNELRALGYIQ